MAAQATASGSCSKNALNVAVFHQRPLIEQRVNTGIHKDPVYMRDKIKDIGTVSRYSDGRMVIMRGTTQGAVAYNEIDTDPADQIDGTMPAKEKCGNTSVRMKGTIEDVDPNACDGICIVDFGQGFYFRGSKDFELELATPVRCTEQLVNFKPSEVEMILNQEVEYFSNTALNSFDHHLVNLVIQCGEANASVTNPDITGQPRLTAGGWSEAPTGHVTIYFLQEYHRQIKTRMRGNNHLGPNEDFVLEVEMTRDAWKLAKILHRLAYAREDGIYKGLGDAIRIDDSVIKGNISDKKSKLKGKPFEMYDGWLRVVFNDEPIRGILRPDGNDSAGNPLFDFVRISPYKNVNAEEKGEVVVDVRGPAGIISMENDDYFRNLYAECGGHDYRVVELIPHVHPMSFERAGLLRSVGPKGVETEGTNFEVGLLKDADLSSAECPNWFKNKYQYAGRHHMRFFNRWPEYSGFILHLREFLPGYGSECIIRTNRNDKDADAKIRPEDYDGCEEHMTCADKNCDKPEVCEDGDNVTELKPCGDVSIRWCGEERTIIFELERSEKCADEAAKVAFEFLEDTALDGEHFSVLDAEGNPTTLTGGFSWAAGEYGVKQICVKILGALPDMEPETPKDDCCQPNELTPQPACFMLKLTDAAGTTLGDCTMANICITNETGETTPFVAEEVE